MREILDFNISPSLVVYEASRDEAELIVFNIDDLIYRLIIEIHIFIIYRVSRYRTISKIYIFIYIENYLIARMTHINTS